MQPVLNVEDVRKVEQDLTLEGVSLAELMRRAGHAVAQEVLDLGNIGPVVVLCGTGNNGGDGVACARLLLEAGYEVRCLLVGSRDKLTPDTRAMEGKLSAAGGKLEPYDPADPDQTAWVLGAHVLVDAIFGTGLNTEVRGEALAAIETMNRSGVPVVSADIPSGVEADTGRVLGGAVRAAVTVTFTRAKAGHFVGKGGLCTGRLTVAPIGIPEDLYLEDDCKTMLVEQADVSLPRRPVDGHKGDFGKVFILAGSRGYTGAAALCARAAVRGGAGLVTVAVPEDVYPIVAVKCDEAMVWPWPGDDGELVEKARGCDAVLIGPGLGQGERAERLVLTLMKELACPVILDADGLNIISRHMDILDERREWSTILTPHDGEFARLSGCELPITDRLGTARSFALRHHCLLVLKGFRTIVSANGACTINPTGNPGMAKGGSGDALAGLMAALLARRGKPDEAITAVWVHGRAGDLAAEDKGEYGMTPSDLIEQIPYAIKELF